MSGPVVGISPSACYIFAAYDLAKTGVSSFGRFQRYVMWYRYLFNEARPLPYMEAKLLLVEVEDMERVLRETVEKEEAA